MICSRNSNTGKGYHELILKRDRRNDIHESCAVNSLLIMHIQEDHVD